jgi:hypothetical protein
LVHLYHLTWRGSADQILANGFVDLRQNVLDWPEEIFANIGNLPDTVNPWGPEYMKVEVGVPMYGRPVPYSEGFEGDTLLEVDLPSSKVDLSQFHPSVGGYVTSGALPQPAEACVVLVASG